MKSASCDERSMSHASVCSRVSAASASRAAESTVARVASVRGAIDELEKRALLPSLTAIATNVNAAFSTHAVAVFSEVYEWAVDQAAAETGLPESTFPTECPYSLEQALGEV